MRIPARSMQLDALPWILELDGRMADIEAEPEMAAKRLLRRAPPAAR